MKFPSRYPAFAPRILGILALFVLMGWMFYLHIPTFKEGYLNAGDDHMHQAFSNELVRVWEGEGRLLGWSRLYGAGAPIFQLRPPGFYIVVGLVHRLTGLSVEQSLKVVVALGFCLYPLAVFWGARLLGLPFFACLVSALLSPLFISLWGHTIDAYQYLGIHKQLLANLMFPLAVGALWRVLKDGRFGALFALLFPALFLIHPYIAYCFFLISPAMVLALWTTEPGWNWKSGIGRGMLWSLPALLLLCLWLIPFVLSPEIQANDPFLSRRKTFDVVVCTTAETFRQFFLGGIFDTSRFSGPFGGTEWVPGNEWGWRDNARIFRFPIITLMAVLGWVGAFFRTRIPAVTFVSAAFLICLLIFIGPDDFPFLDLIPFADQFQNIHAVFVLEWATLMMAGLGAYWVFRSIRRAPWTIVRRAAFVIAILALAAGYATAVYERTDAARRNNDVRNIYTRNGDLVLKPGISDSWRQFVPVLELLNAKDAPSGNIAAFPQAHEDSVLYNLLPLMSHRPVFICGFELVGGVYDLILTHFRTNMRDNYRLQQLFNIRHVINNPALRKVPMDWHHETRLLHQGPNWELAEVKGVFSDVETVSDTLVGFIGPEAQWGDLMRKWLEAYQRGGNPPWIVNFTHSGLNRADVAQLLPFIAVVLTATDAKIPKEMAFLRTIPLASLPENAMDFLRRELDEQTVSHGNNTVKSDIKTKIYQWDRAGDVLRVETPDAVMPLLVKRAFYRGWKARMDGRETPIYRISPGLQLVLVPEGKHLLSFVYTGPNGWGWARVAFGAGMAMIFLLFFLKHFRVFAFMSGNAPFSETKPDKPRNWRERTVVLLWLVFVLVFGVQVFSEGILKKPVSIYPQKNAAISESAVDIYWNYITGIPVREQRFQVQVAADSAFQSLVTQTEAASDHCRLSGALETKGVYYYRVRLLLGDKPFGWSKPVKFRRL